MLHGAAVLLALTVQTATAQEATVPATVTLPQTATAQLSLRLDELFSLAEAHNSSIQSYRSAVAVAQEAWRAAQAAVLPDVGLQLQVSYLGNGHVWDRDFTNHHVADIPHFGNAAQLQLSMPLYAGGALRSGIRQSEQRVQMAELQQEENRSRVRRYITQLYLALHTLHNEATVFSDNIALARQMVQLMQQRCQEGVVLQNDVTRYELLLEKLLLQQTEVAHQQSIVAHQLSTTLGIDTALVLLPDTAFALDALPRATEAQWQLQARQQSHSLRMASLAKAMSEERVRSERAALLPTVGLLLEDNLTGPITIEIPALNNNFNYWFVGLGLKYNLSSLYKNNRQVRRAKADVGHAADALRAAEDQVDVAVQAAHTDYLTALASLSTQRKNIQLAASNYDVVRNRYDNGLALITDLLDAANEKLDAELKMVNARMKVIDCYYNIKYISGTL